MKRSQIRIFLRIQRLFIREISNTPNNVKIDKIFDEGGIRLKNSLLSTSTNPCLPSVISNEDNVLRWYSCGPTVYDAAHIGHGRTYVCTDIIRRILTDIHNKDVNFAMGITDIDDKIIDRGTTKGLVGWNQMEGMVRALEDDFFNDLDALNVRRPDAVLRVTEHINEIIKYIETINASGRSYVTPDGVYFSVASCGDSYIQFRDITAGGNTDSSSNNNSSSSIDGIDISSNSSSNISSDNNSKSSVSNSDSSVSSNCNNSCRNVNEPPEKINTENAYKPASLGHKKDLRDFALWKTVKEGEPCWDSPWGPGRPGWHIECSAVTNSYFGPCLDIHSGGIDLQFPHHTNEIAQCSAHNNCLPKDWVKYWMHTGHLYIEGRKMSKSSKNFISIKDYLTGNYSTHPAIDFRIFCLQYKYHSSIHFSQDRVDDASNFRYKIETYFNHSDQVVSSIREKQQSGQMDMNSKSSSHVVLVKPTQESRALRESLLQCKGAVNKALRNDFDTPECLKHISYLIGDTMRYASLVAIASSSSSSSLSCQDSMNNTNSSNSNSSNSNNNNTSEAYDNTRTKTPTQQPIEPLIAVTHYIADILNKLGVNIRQNNQLNPSLDAQQGVEVIPFEGKLLDELLAFRCKVRSTSLHGLKNIKIELKKNKNKLKNSSTAIPSTPSEVNTGDSSAGSVVVAKRALEDVLTVCDHVRDSVGPQLGIHIDDLSETLSVWRPTDVVPVISTSSSIVAENDAVHDDKKDEHI